MQQTAITLKCAWCGLIQHHQQWHAERRQRPVRYSHGICPQCRDRNFPQWSGPDRRNPAERRGPWLASWAALLNRWFRSS